MCAFRYPNKAAFQRITPNIFSCYANHFVGEHVFGLRAKDDKGRSMAQPSFELLLSYEYQVRKAAIKKLNKGHSWVDSLKEAMVDTLVKERFLTTPLACNSWVATKSRSRSRRRSRGREPRADRSTGRNKGKPKGKGSSRKSKGGNAQEGAWHSTTPDGRQICYKSGEVPGPMQPRALLPQVLGVSPTASVSSQPQRRGEGRDPALRTTGGSGWARGAGAHLQRAVPLQRRGKEVINRQPTAKDGFKGGLQGAHSQEPGPRPHGRGQAPGHLGADQGGQVRGDHCHSSLRHMVAGDLGQSLRAQASARRNKALGVPMALREAAEAGRCR